MWVARKLSRYAAVAKAGTRNCSDLRRFLLNAEVMVCVGSLMMRSNIRAHALSICDVIGIIFMLHRSFGCRYPDDFEDSVLEANHLCLVDHSARHEDHGTVREGRRRNMRLAT